jgi:serine protease AprX
MSLTALPFVNDLTEFQPALSTPARLGADPAFTGRGVTIAFLDSGFYPHVDLVEPFNRVKAYVDATGPKISERPSIQTPRTLHASSWHGTMTSCACAGDGGLSRGVYRGVASGAELVLVKTGQPNTFRISERDIARSLAWVISNSARLGVRIINISLGGDLPSRGKLTPLDRLVEDAAALGISVVCAAGNSGTKKMIPPASAPSAITVGGLNDQNMLDRARWSMYHSSYGIGGNGAIKPELIAPAQWVAAPMLPDSEPHKRAQLLWQLEEAPERRFRELLKSTEAEALLGMDVQKPHAMVRRLIRQKINDEKFIHRHYQHVDGTSFAAPLTSAVVAQMLEANPVLSPAQVKQILQQTATPLDDVEVERQGAGVINAAAAVAEAVKQFARVERALVRA